MKGDVAQSGRATSQISSEPPEERCEWLKPPPIVSSNLTIPTPLLKIKNVFFSYNDIDRKIKIPDILDAFLAEDIGIQIGDGSLPLYIDKKSVQHYVIGCYGNIIEDRIYLKNLVIPLKRRLFNIDLRLNDHPTAGECYIKFESKAIFTFYKNVIGLQTGRKNNIPIPKIILKAPLEIKLACVRGIADTDFSLVFKKDFKKVNRDPYIQLGCASKNLIKQIARILKEIGITSTTIFDCEFKTKNRDKIYIKHYLNIHGKRNLEKWMELIGFNNPIHFTKYLIWKKFGVCPPYTTLNQRFTILRGKTLPFNDFTF